MLENEFKIKLLQSNGNEFQEFFHRIMRHYKKDFLPITSNGSNGDHGCDGYINKDGKGTYFQVYGPNDSAKKSTIYTAKQKLKIFLS